MDPHTTVSPIEHYREHGYVVFRDVIDPALIAEASAHVDWLLEQNPGTRPELLDFHLAVDDPFWLRLVGDDRLLDLAQPFIGPDIALFATHYISKPPHDGRPVLWHQDGSYWPLEPMDVVTLWLAVDPSIPENGCMKVIPGTQHLDLQALRDRDDVESVLGSGLDEEGLETDRAVDIVLNPGDVSIHHPNVIHGSQANTSDLRRCGLTIRYIPTTTRITGPNASPFLLRGNAVDGVNTYLPRPRYVEGRHYPFRGCEDWA
jgi:ectoine hydroxylase-related dioxygenase (phytanoyl-CoA dioxygenase family)